MAFRPRFVSGLALAILFSSVPLCAQQTIITAAGTTFIQPLPPAPALQFSFASISSIVSDSKGNVYVADAGTQQVFRIDSSGTVTLFAGNGVAGVPAGDGGPAANATLGTPAFLATDSSGNVYVLEHNIAFNYNDDIRMVTPDGTIDTFWVVPDEYNRAAANFGLDAAGNMYVVYVPGQVLKVTPDGTASVFAGTGQFGNAGDGGPALAATFGVIEGIGVDSSANVYVGDQYYGAVRRISPAGAITKVYSGGAVNALAATPQGNLYLSTGNQIAAMSSGAAAKIIAGTGVFGWTGDGGPALAANLVTAGSLTVDASGAVYLADSATNVVRRVSAAGTISQYAGAGSYSYSGDTGPAGLASLNYPYGLVSGSAGSFYVSDQKNQRIRSVSSSGLITTVAGNGRPGYSGDGGPATLASLYNPAGIALDSSGNLFIVDSGNSVVRKVTPSGVITTVAGTGAAGYSGDGGSALKAALSGPLGVAIDAGGNLYIADTNNHRIRKVTAAGIITTVAGNGNNGYAGDGGPAVAATLTFPTAIVVDSSGALYLADSLFAVVRKVTPGGLISTVAGMASQSYSSGDGGLATNAGLSALLYGLAIDSHGDLLIVDSSNANVRSVSSAGIISTIAGMSGTANAIQLSLPGCLGAGGPPTSAELIRPRGIAVDSAGVIYIADTGNNCVRAIYGPTSPSFTPAGLANAASYAGGELVPGSFTALFGSNLASGSGTIQAAKVPLPQSLAGVTVLVNGMAAPLFAVANSQQINFQVPWEVAGQAAASVQVVNNGAPGPVVWAPVAPAQPGIFTDAQGFGIILHAATYTLVDNKSPAAPGEPLVIYATGLGAVSATGRPATGAAPTGAAATVIGATVTIGGVNAPVLYSGLAPDLVGVYQLNVTVPAGITSGNRPVQISVAGTLSNSAVLALEVPPPQDSSAAGAAFRPSGPDGATFLSLAVDPANPGTVYAGTLNGVWKSTDGAATWRNVYPFISTQVWSVVVSPSRAVYAGTNNSNEGVEVSNDGGNTWKALIIPVQDTVSQVVPDPLNAQTIYALTILSGLFRSSDAGSNWSPVQLPSTCVSLHYQAFQGYLVADTATEGKLYYGSCDGFYISSDGGQSWTKHMTGADPSYPYPSQIALAPGDPLRIYAVFETPGVVPGELYVSRDGGGTWTDSTMQCTNFAVSPANENEIFTWGQLGQDFNSYLWKTLDGGTTWRAISAQPQAGVGLLTFLSTSPEVMLGQSDVYLLRTADGGVSWNYASKGVSEVFGYQVAVDPEAPSVVYLAASNNAGLYRSADAGTTWSRLQGGVSAVAIAVDPFDSRHLLAAAIDPGVFESSVDSGATWEPIITAFPIVPFPNNIVFDGTSRGTVYLVFGTGLAKSADGGQTWSLLTNGLPTGSNLSGWALAIDPANPLTLILTTDNGIYKSVDGGGSWQSKNTSQAYEPVFDPNHQGVVYAGGYQLLLKSSDDGETWSRVNLGRADLEGPFAVTVDPEFADNVFLAPFEVNSGATVGKSLDGGKTWTWLTAGLGLNLLGNYTSGISIAESAPEVLYVISSSGGVVALTLSH